MFISMQKIKILIYKFLKNSQLTLSPVSLSVLYFSTRVNNVDRDYKNSHHAKHLQFISTSLNCLQLSTVIWLPHILIQYKIQRINLLRSNTISVFLCWIVLLPWQLRQGWFIWYWTRKVDIQNIIFQKTSKIS